MLFMSEQKLPRELLRDSFCSSIKTAKRGSSWQFLTTCDAFASHSSYVMTCDATPERWPVTVKGGAYEVRMLT